LFGGAILATIATASLAQTYLTNVAALRGSVVSSGYVVLAGYSIAGDGGGGTFLPGAAGCTVDGGTVFQDKLGNCFYRADPTSASASGARCATWRRSIPPAPLRPFGTLDRGRLRAR
jgi:hypothetical protein